MARVKREGSEAPHAPKRVRGKNRVGGDLPTLLELHQMAPVHVRRAPWPEAGPAVTEVGDAHDLADAVHMSRPLPHQVDAGWHPACHANEAPWYKLPPAPPSQAWRGESLSVALTVGSTPVALAPYKSATLGTTAYSPDDPRNPAQKYHMLDTGGYLYDLAWAPQSEAQDAEWLAVACASTRDARTKVGEASQNGMIQLWCIPANNEPPCLVMVLHSEAGTPCRLAWCPAGGTGIGILAAVYTDGGIRILDVPQPTAPLTQIEAFVYMTLAVEGTTCASLAWSGDRLAAGCTNGRHSY